MVEQEEIQLFNLLTFDQSRGEIFLKDYRMLLFSARAIGALRKELLETLGAEQARGVLKRFGYAAGMADGIALLERFPNASRFRHLQYGPLLNALEGFARVSNIPDRSDVDLEKGVFHIEAIWENSYEAEQHLDMFGKSPEPVCWTLMGYAAGHSSAILNQKTLVVERECRAMGHAHCRFIADLDHNFSEEYNIERRDYEALRMPELLQNLRETIMKQQSSLQEQQKTIITLQSKLTPPADFGGMLGSSKALSKSIEMARLVAPVDSTVLILGESGTGKELLARGIHQHSLRADKPFVAVNCSALPETLQEAELFGFVKGAFTGATTAQEGLFETASKGTLFLDEIGDLTLSAQTKMLRTLQEGEIKRIGENKVRKVDVRIIAATHQNLEEMMTEGKFREDLYYRLNVVTIELPPLRERDNDALLLAEYFIKKFAGKFSKRKVKGLSCEAARAIARYPWPGNVRELEHAIERAVILAGGTIIEITDLPEKVAGYRLEKHPVAGSPLLPVKEAVAGMHQSLWEIADEAERIHRALQMSSGNREKAAQLLGMSRTTLWRRLRKLSID